MRDSATAFLCPRCWTQRTSWPSLVLIPMTPPLQQIGFCTIMLSSSVNPLLLTSCLITQESVSNVIKQLMSSCTHCSFKLDHRYSIAAFWYHAIIFNFQFRNLICQYPVEIFTSILDISIMTVEGRFFDLLDNSKFFRNNTIELKCCQAQFKQAISIEMKLC